MLVVSTCVSLAVLLYATGQGMADGDEDGPVSVFHPTYLILVAGVSNAFLAGDLFNLYVGLRDPADRLLRAADPRRHHGAHPRRA